MVSLLSERVGLDRHRRVQASRFTSCTDGLSNACIAVFGICAQPQVLRRDEQAEVIYAGPMLDPLAACS